MNMFVENGIGRQLVPFVVGRSRYEGKCYGKLQTRVVVTGLCLKI